MFVLIESWTKLKIGHVGIKTRSLDRILEKPLVRSRGHIFIPIIMKPGQILEKRCVSSRGHIFSQIIMKLGQNFCVDELLDELEMGHVGSKTRSLGHILENPNVYSRGHIFSFIIMKLGQNVCLHEILHKFENSKTRSLDH